MTSMALDDSVDRTGDQQTRQPDELEDWLTDLRVTLNDDPPDWLTLEDHTVDPAAAPEAWPPPTGDHAAPDTGTPDHSAGSHGSLKGDQPGPAAGRHRAAE